MLVSLVIGSPFWIALLVYVGVGSFWILAGTGILAIREALSKPGGTAQKSRVETRVGSS